MEVLGVIVGEDQLGACHLVIALELARALLVLRLRLFLGDGFPDAVFVLFGEVGADGAVLQLHDGFAGVPLVEEFQQVDGAFTLLGDAELTGGNVAAGADGDVAGAVGAGENGQEYIVLRVIAHELLDVPPGGNADIALLALGHQLGVILREDLLVDQTRVVPVVEVGERLKVLPA